MREIRAGMRALLTVPFLLLLSACAGLQHRDSREQMREYSPNDRYLEFSGDQLIDFAGDLSRLNPAARLVECQKILAYYRENRQLPILLHLFAAQTVTEGCGDLSRTTRVVRAFSGQLEDLRLRNFLSYQMVLADRTIASSAERNRLQRRLDHARSNLRKAMSESRQAVSSSKQALSKQREALTEREQALSQTREIYRQMVSRDAEARQLKEKLDALKTIEQDLNDTER